VSAPQTGSYRLLLLSDAHRPLMTKPSWVDNDKTLPGRWSIELESTTGGPGFPGHLKLRDDACMKEPRDAYTLSAAAANEQQAAGHTGSQNQRHRTRLRNILDEAGESERGCARRGDGADPVEPEAHLNAVVDRRDKQRRQAVL